MPVYINFDWEMYDQRPFDRRETLLEHIMSGARRAGMEGMDALWALGEWRTSQNPKPFAPTTEEALIWMAEHGNAQTPGETGYGGWYKLLKEHHVIVVGYAEWIHSVLPRGFNPHGVNLDAWRQTVAITALAAKK